MRAKNIYLFLISIVFYFLGGVECIKGQSPYGLKWYRIKTPHYRIVFHDGLQDKALETAAIMEHVWDKIPDVYPVKPPLVDLYLNSLTTTSNAFAALGPRHMHIFLHPPQQTDLLGSAEWINLTAVHEYRHITQFDYLNRHYLSFFSGLFGDFGRAAPAFLLVPRWYYEGDAISAETLFTSQGRGRMPEFEMPLKALLTGTDQNFTYNQASLLSYKSYFPNHYYLGYFMHTHVARNYDLDTWPKIIESVSKGKSFSGSVKRHTGYPSRKIYRNAMDELKELWKDDIKPLPSYLTPLRKTDSNDYTNYRYGHRMSDGSVVSVRYGLGYAAEIIHTDESNKDRRLSGLNSDIKISSNGQHIVWSSLKPHVRWEMQDYSDIMLLDIATDKVTRLTSGEKYMSPAISPDGKRVAAINYRENLEYSIDIIDTEKGNLLIRIPAEKGQLPRTPSWSAGGEHLIYTLSGGGHSSLCLVNIKTNYIETITVHPSENISSPVISGQYIYFISTAGGENALHAINWTTGERFIALSGGYGLFNPVWNYESGEMIIEAYTPYGYRLYSWFPDEADFIPFSPVENENHYITPVINSAYHYDLFEDFEPQSTEFKIKPYNHLLHGLKLHSWFFLPEQQGVSGTILANDPLAIHNISATVGYNQNENTSFQSIDYTFRRFYPVYTFSGVNGTRYNYSSTESEFYKWNEKHLALGVLLPLNFTTNEFIRNSKIFTNYNYTFINELDNRFIDYYDQGNGTFSWYQTGFAIQSHRNMAPRDFYPSLGLSVNLSYSETINSTDYIGSLISFSSMAYLPGLAKHHSLRALISLEKQQPDFTGSGYVFPSEVLFFRGYKSEVLTETQKLSVDYAFPLVYPDIGLGALIYCKRIRTNLFFDTGLGEIFSNTHKFRSYGVDFLFDLNFFRFPAEIDLGIRLSNTTEKDFVPEFIFFQRF